jgi:hypothetical protein
MGRHTLGRVRVVIHPRHKNYTVEDHAPLFSKHATGLSPESSRRSVLNAGFLRFDELTGLREGQAYEADSDGEAGTDPEHSLP